MDTNNHSDNLQYRMPYSKSGWSLHVMPVGYLMIEHRLIEKMIGLLEKELSNIRKKKKIKSAFVNIAVDFIRTYADKCHHGKEEDILFRDLSKRKISPEHNKTMNELIDEHKLGRKTTASLVEAKNDYAQGKTSALKDIIKHAKWLVEFYPKHIEKEDKYFFIPSMSYFNKKEQDDMLVEFYKADGGTAIHDKYRKIVKELGK